MRYKSRELPALLLGRPVRRFHLRRLVFLRIPRGVVPAAQPEKSPSSALGNDSS